MYPHGFIFPAGLVFGVFFLVPTALAFYFSLTRWTLFDATFIGLDNFGEFLERPQLIGGLRNTLIYAVLTSGLKGHPRLPLAMLLTSRIRARGSARIIFFPVLVSTVAVGITFATLMQPSVGLINTDPRRSSGSPHPDWLGNPDLALLSVALVDVWKGVGIATVIFIAGILSIPVEYFEAARLEGGTWVKFRYVIIPLARNATFTVILLSFIGGLRSFDLIWTMTHGGPGFAIGRAHLGDLQGVSGGVLWPVDRRQCGPVHSRHDPRLSADAVLPSGRLSCEGRSSWPGATGSTSSRSSIGIVVLSCHSSSSS